MLEVLVINSVFSTNAALVRRSCLLEVGGFDETLRYAEDYDLWLRMAARGYRFAYIDRPLVKYRIHGDNKIFAMPAKRLRSLERIWDRVVQSNAFHRLPGHVRADFFTRVATAEVLADRPPEARQALREAIACDPYRLLPRLWLGMLVLGNHPLKRLITARRGLIRLRRRWAKTRDNTAIRPPSAGR